MPHRAHLFSLRLGHALRESLAERPYSFQRFLQDLTAGISVGLIAIPLAMALAIASGVSPQYGLYTAFIAGFVIALTGGSRYSISGPTAAFVVILYPIAQQYGLSGLLQAGFLAGLMLVAMAFLRLGRLIEYIPESVTLGFTGGIAIGIATLQVNDFFGLGIDGMPEHYHEKIVVLGEHLPHPHWPSMAVAFATLAVLLLWRRVRTIVPSALPAVLVGTTLALLLAHYGHPVDTIGSRFSWTLPDGSSGNGIPSALPGFMWPWLQPDASGNAGSFSWAVLFDLLPKAFSIAMLCAIEALLCAVVLDGMSGRRHSANSELLGQGIGNLIVPFFGGITATAAIARSAANLKAGAQTTIAAAIHAVLVLLALLMLARWLAYLPMPCMAALLVMVAWNMSEAPKSVKLLRTAPRADMLVFAVCLGLTVFVDMVVAITCGLIIAAFSFIRDVAEMTRVDDISSNPRWVKTALPDGFRVLRIRGPLFFAAADKVFGSLPLLLEADKGVVLQMDAVPVLDGGGLHALERFIDWCHRHQVNLVISELQFQPLKTLRKADLQPVTGLLSYAPDIETALSLVDTPQADPEVPSRIS